MSAKTVVAMASNEVMGPEATPALPANAPQPVAVSDGSRTSVVADCVFMGTQPAKIGGKVAPSDATQESCYICTRSYAITELQNAGCKVYPKLRCKACHTAVRTLERAAKSQGEEAASRLSHLRKTNTKRFNAQVLSIRIGLENEPEPANGAGSGSSTDLPPLMRGGGRSVTKEDIQQRVQSVVTALTSEKYALNYDEVAWLTEREYRGYFKAFQDYTSSEAQEKWNRDVMDSKIRRRVEADGSVRLAVRMAPRTQTGKKSSSKRVYEAVEEESGSEVDMDDVESAKKLRSHSHGDAGNFMMDTFGQNLLLESAHGEEKVRETPRGAQTVQACLQKMAGGSRGGGAGAAGGPEGPGDGTIEVPDADAVTSMGLVKVRLTHTVVVCVSRRGKEGRRISCKQIPE